MDRSDRLLIVHHSADLDGRFSGMLAKKAFQKYIDNKTAEIVGYNYGTDETIDTWLGSYGEQFDKFLFIDITPPIDWLKKYSQEILEESMSVTICDHHYPKYEEIKLILDNDEIHYYFDREACGAKIFLNYNFEIVENLMFEQPDRNICEIKNLAEIVRFVSLYDTWQFASKSQTIIENTLAIKEYFDMFSDVDSLETAFDNIDSISGLIAVGELLTEKSIKTAQINVAQGAIFVGSRFIDVWHELDKVISEETSIYLFSGYPDYYVSQLVQQYGYYIGYSINLKTQKVKMNIRSQNGGNAVNLAKTLNKNGGGHKQAAGCEISLAEFIQLIFHTE